MVGIARKRYRSLHFSFKSFGKIFGLTLLLALTIFTLAKLKTAEFFPIKNVQVFGIHHLNQIQVQQIVTPLVNKGFFAADVDQIKERLMQLAWVQNVIVRRIWPDQVVITVNEKSPFAIWNNGSLLSAAGELFSPDAGSYPYGLPQLIGPQGEQILMTKYFVRMSSIITPLHFKIARLELTPSMAWTITLDNGIKLNLGHKDVLTRLNHFVKVYPKIVGEKVANVEYIDLRYPNGMAVRWKSVT